MAKKAKAKIQPSVLLNVEQAANELLEFEATNIFTEEEVSFLPEPSEESEEASENAEIAEALEGSELEGFDAASIEEIENIEDERLYAIIEGVLFASDRPVSLPALKAIFKGTNIKTEHIRKVLKTMTSEFNSGNRGMSLEEVPGGYQLRTKAEHMLFLSRTVKSRAFRLSGPALEVLAIVAYKQPIVKAELDQIRGVESGHLLRALMEKSLVVFEGKSDLPGKPMLYATTKKFLEIFGLRNLKELPTLSQIDELLPDGIGEENPVEEQGLSDLTEKLSQNAGASYSENEDELVKISDELSQITTSSEFFENEKIRQREKRDADRAQNIRDAMTVGEEVSTRDKNWLTKYEEALTQGVAVEIKPDLDL